MSTSILIADDHRMIRDGLRGLLGKEFGFEVVAEAGDGREAVEKTWSLKPDVVVMDVDMPKLNGVEATRKIRARQPDVKIVALSMHTNEKYVNRMLEAGATSYLLKDCAFDELVEAIRAALAGRSHRSSEGSAAKGRSGRATGPAPKEAAAETTTIVRQPQLVVTHNGPQKMFLGRNICHKISVSNQGDGVARGTVVQTTIPGGSRFVSASDGGR
jgi:uncharacterized repeat protein (TIGR01451 family)